MVIKALQGDTRQGMHIQTIIKNNLVLLSSFETISFSFVHSECNMVEHKLARWASSSVCDEVWVSSDPSWIVHVPLSDILHYYNYNIAHPSYVKKIITLTDENVLCSRKRFTHFLLAEHNQFKIDTSSMRHEI